MGNSYAEKLKDPRWQRKRLEVMQRSDFRCDVCGADKNTLHVHHGIYVWGRDIWEHPLETLHCLCEKCHPAAGEELYEARLILAQIPPARMIELLEVLDDFRNYSAGNYPLPESLESAGLGPRRAFYGWLLRKLQNIIS